MPVATRRKEKEEEEWQGELADWERDAQNHK
jgi:hypothetical protein